jgi:hypothetical protein
MNEKLSTMPVSMYSELLAVSLAIDEETARAHAANEEWLLEELLLARRHRQETGRAAGHSDASSRIAAELEYDRALVRLCRLHAIPCGAERFTRPLRERQRLEDALEALGVDVTGARSGDDHLRASIGHEPPEGS